MLSERKQYLIWADEAVSMGARQEEIGQELGVSTRTLRRWRDEQGLILTDKRQEVIRPEPKNKLSVIERCRVIEVCNQAEYASLPPSQIVPRLADKGIYLASESTFYRVLKSEDQ